MRFGAGGENFRAAQKGEQIRRLRRQQTLALFRTCPTEAPLTVSEASPTAIEDAPTSTEASSTAVDFELVLQVVWLSPTTSNSRVVLSH
jgi:hypothetical protein